MDVSAANQKQETTMAFVLWLVIATSHGVTTNRVAAYPSMKDCTESGKATQFAVVKGDAADQTVTFVCTPAR